MLTFAPLLLAIMVAAGIMLVVFGLARREAPIADRLERFAERPRSLEALELERPFKDRFVRPTLLGMARMIGRFAPQSRVEKTRIDLLLAGSPGNMQVADFMGMRILLTVLISSVVAGLFWLAKVPFIQLLVFSSISAAFGYFFPVLWLSRKITKRKKEIFRALPDAIDLLTISVDAGLAFDSALQRVSEKWDNALSREFRRVIAEIRVGKPRREALRELALRTGVSELSTFVASIIQADQLGVSISRVLQVQAEQMRLKRRQWAEAEAHRAPLKMMFPVAFCILPALYVMILGPALPKMVDLFFK
jgi:tight adherence protein C